MSEIKIQEEFEKFFIKEKPGITGIIKGNRTQNGYKSIEINEFYKFFKFGYNWGKNV